MSPLVRKLLGMPQNGCRPVDNRYLRIEYAISPSATLTLRPILGRSASPAAGPSGHGRRLFP